MNTFLTILFIIVAMFGLVYIVGYAFSGGSTHIVVKEKWDGVTPLTIVGGLQ